MIQAAKIAQAFHEAYEHMAPIFGYETRPESAVPWDEVPQKNRAVMVATISYLLDQHIIEAPRRLPRRRELANPGAVKVDVDKIGKLQARELVGLIAGLSELYARAHDEVLAGGGAGELGAGRGSLHGVNPTEEHGLDGFGIRENEGGKEDAAGRKAHLVIEGGKAWRRHQVRQVADSIGEARNRLYTARETLEAIAPEKGFRQPTKPAASEADVDEDELAESIRKQEERAAGGDV